MKNIASKLPKPKPCPWCGEEVTPEVIEGTTFRWRKFAGCCADGPEVRHATLAEDQEAAELQSTINAIEAWNGRAGDEHAEMFRWMRDNLAVIRLVMDRDADRYQVETRTTLLFAPADSYEAAVRAAMQAQP